MPIRTDLILLYGFELIIFAAYIYMIVFMRLKYMFSMALIDFILIGLQLIIFIVFINDINAAGTTMVAATPAVENEVLIFIMHGAFFSLVFIRFIYLLKNAPALRTDLLTAQSVHEAIDYIPGGICFADTNGRPILTNRRMNELVYSLTNTTLMDLNTVWDDLKQNNLANGCKKLEKYTTNNKRKNYSVADNIFDVEGNSIIVLLPDDIIWEFRKTELYDRFPLFIQLEALEITDLYRYSKNLYDNNNLLAEQHARQRKLLENIVKINRDKEIVSTKMRIHDDFGQSILTTRQHLARGTINENVTKLADEWKNTITRMEDYAHIYADDEVSPEIELLRAAEMIGCNVEFIGARPQNRRTALLLYAAVREALTNAVMHAEADRLIVKTTQSGNGYRVDITDNGNERISSVIEGNGLSNLRKRLEQEGATLRILCEGGVALILELPS